MSIKTPVKVRVNTANDWGYHDVLEDANGDFLCECDGGKGPALAHALNTHAALRASHAELVAACKLAVPHMADPNAYDDLTTLPVAVVASKAVHTALFNAAKVEVGHE